MTTIWIVSMNSWMRIFCRLKSGTVSIGWKHSIRYAFDQPQGDLCNVVLGGARRSYTKMCSKERSLEPCETRITIPLSDDIPASLRQGQIFWTTNENSIIRFMSNVT